MDTEDTPEGGRVASACKILLMVGTDAFLRALVEMKKIIALTDDQVAGIYNQHEEIWGGSHGDEADDESSAGGDGSGRVDPSSRGGGKRRQRKVTNEADLLVSLRSVLSRSGFSLIVIHAEKMSVEKQIAVWSSVDLAVVERGAGMANCLFLRRNAAVVYVSNANAYESHSVMLPRPSPRHYKVVPANGLPGCKNFDSTCTCNVTAVEGAVIQATRHIWDY